MANVIEATYDGRVFCPDEPLDIAPNTRVRIAIEAVTANGEEPPSVLDVALSLNLDGPPDWATNIDRYLYGDLGQDAAEQKDRAE